jgi:DNA-binding NtrC family response regulator
MHSIDSVQHILLVEDESDHAELICRAFADSPNKYSVIVARTLAEARAEIENHTPKLALVDNGLPDGQGIVLVPLGRDRFPVVILTAHGGEQLAVQALKAGALDYVVKSPEAFNSMPHTVERTMREWHLIQERKQADTEREKLIRELQKALANVKKLSGLIPICSSCKKIRDDKGYWNQLEKYLIEHSDAELSHGICPDCAKKLYPEYYDKRKGGDDQEGQPTQQ